MWELDYKEGWVLKNWCFWVVVLEKALESPLNSKEIKPVNSKGNQPWVFAGRTDAEAPILWPSDAKRQLIRSSNTLATWFEELTHLKIPWCWERLGEGGEGDNRGWDGWMASSTQWTRVWANSRRQWKTGKAGVLHSTRLKRVEHDWATEQQFLEVKSTVSPPRLKSRCWLGCLLSEALREHQLPRPAARASYTPWIWPPSCIFKVNSNVGLSNLSPSDLCFSYRISFSWLWPSSPIHRDSCGYTESTRVIQGNSLMARLLIQSHLQSVLPCKVSLSWVLGIWI